MATLVGEHRRRLAVTGAAAAVAGAIGLACVYFAGLVAGQMARLDERAAMVALADRVVTEPPMQVFPLLLAAGAIGWVTLAVGLYRSRAVPRAAAMLVGIGGAATMVTAAGPVRAAVVASSVIALAGFAWVAAASRPGTSRRHAPQTVSAPDRSEHRNYGRSRFSSAGTRQRMGGTMSLRRSRIAVAAVMSSSLLAGLAVAESSGATTPDTTLPSTGEGPVGVIAIGHSGLTGENSDPDRPGQPALENSWATGTNPEVNSIYLRLVEVQPETEGHVANTAVGGALASTTGRTGRAGDEHRADAANSSSSRRSTTTCNVRSTTPTTSRQFGDSLTDVLDADRHRVAAVADLDGRAAGPSDRCRASRISSPPIRK